MKTNEGFGILSACEHVHMCSTGAAEVSSRDEILDLVAGLQERLENWRASDSTYDQAVKKLMWAAIVDGMQFLARSK